MIGQPRSMQRLASFLVAATATVLPLQASAQNPSSTATGQPSFIDERRLPAQARDPDERQRVIEEEARKAADEVRKRFEAEAAALRAQLEAAAAEHRKRLEQEAAAQSQRLSAESEARRTRELDEAERKARAEEEARQRAAAAAEAAENERKAKAEGEARQLAAAAEAAARKAETERQAKAEEEARQRAAAAAAEAAARKAETERQAKAAEEARRKTLGITGNPVDGARYLARGQQLLSNGDFASARLFLERASDSGSADGALLLAETYDAVAQRRLGAVGVSPDASLARRWYQRAAALGSTVAAERLKQLGGQ